MNQERRKIICPVCGDNAEEICFQNCHRIICQSCKDFNIGDAFNLPTLSENEKIKLRHLYATLDEKDNKRCSFCITNKNKEKLLGKLYIPNNSIEKRDYILKYIKDNIKAVNESFRLNLDFDYRKLYCTNKEELIEILKRLQESGYIIGGRINSFDIIEPNTPIVKNIKITDSGLEKICFVPQNLNSPKVFLSMWFNDTTDSYYKKVDESIRKLNYTPYRIDKDEHLENIAMKILEEIKSSRFIIADLTGYRGGVYFEAGYAKGLNIPVIFTCKENWFDDIKDINGQIEQQGVHFNLRQHNIIFWDDNKLNELEERLIKRIQELIPQSPILMPQTS